MAGNTIIGKKDKLKFVAFVVSMDLGIFQVNIQGTLLKGMVSEKGFKNSSKNSSQSNHFLFEDPDNGDIIMELWVLWQHLIIIISEEQW